MAVRRRKLPDPEQIPNAGSFFKNPVVSLAAWEQLKATFPDIAAYPGEGTVKLAAGWLIDQCGWKGYRNDKVGVHNHQALVLINHSSGTGKDILALAERIRADVADVYGVELEIEPGIVSG
jgi:UDP-N-acetylmuramate dehydrogenase